MTIRPIRTMMNHATTEVFLDGVEVPADALVGEEGKGFRYILDGMNAERILIAAECIGDGRWFVEKAARYASERVVFGRPIGANQGVQFPIARAHAAIEAADLVQGAGSSSGASRPPRRTWRSCSRRSVVAGGERVPRHPRRLRLRRGVRRRAQVRRRGSTRSRRLEQPDPRLPRPARARHAAFDCQASAQRSDAGRGIASTSAQRATGAAARPPSSASILAEAAEPRAASGRACRRSLWRSSTCSSASPVPSDRLRPAPPGAGAVTNPVSRHPAGAATRSTTELVGRSGCDRGPASRERDVRTVGATPSRSSSSRRQTVASARHWAAAEGGPRLGRRPRPIPFRRARGPRRCSSCRPSARCWRSWASTRASSRPPGHLAAGDASRGLRSSRGSAHRVVRHPTSRARTSESATSAPASRRPNCLLRERQALSVRASDDYGQLSHRALAARWCPTMKIARRTGGWQVAARCRERLERVERRAGRAERRGLRRPSGRAVRRRCRCGTGSVTGRAVVRLRRPSACARRRRRRRATARAPPARGRGR